MKTYIYSSIFIIAVSGMQIINAQTQKGNDIDGEAAGDWSGSALSMPDANTIAIGAYRNDGNGTDAGHVRVYNWNGSAWTQKGTDIDGESFGDYSGSSLSMPDPNTIAIGAGENGVTNNGHVRIYRWNGSSWVQKGLDIDGEASYDHFGIVSMPDSNTVAIGAYLNDGSFSNAGHVRIYTWNGSAWIQKGLNINGEANDDYSGSSISMPDSYTLAIGAYANDGNGTEAGHVRVYTWKGSAWVQKGMDIDGEALGDWSGRSVSMPDSNTVAIGAMYNDGNGTDAGHVRIYSWNGSDWQQKGNDIDGDAPNDKFGSFVYMLDSNTIAISGPSNDANGSDAGHVRVFKWIYGDWVQYGVDIYGEAPFDYSGNSICMPDSNTIAIGAPFNDGNGSDAGHVRVYSFSTIVDVIDKELENIVLFPNPTSNQLNIHVKDMYTHIKVIVRNSIGQEIINKSYTSKNKIKLEIEGDPGIYFVEVISNNKTKVLKFIKK